MFVYRNTPNSLNDRLVDTGAMTKLHISFRARYATSGSPHRKLVHAANWRSIKVPLAGWPSERLHDECFTLQAFGWYHWVVFLAVRVLPLPARLRIAKLRERLRR